MMRSFNELFDEYEKSIICQKNIIGKYREKLKKAQTERNFKEVKRLNSLLRVLYEEKSELEERAIGLKDYIKQ